MKPSHSIKKSYVTGMEPMAGRSTLHDVMISCCCVEGGFLNRNDLWTDFDMEVKEALCASPVRSS